MPVRHTLLAVAVAVVWGINFVVIHVGLESFPPLLFAALRFTLVALPAVFFIARPAIPIRYVVGVGLFMSTGQFALLFVSMHAGMPAGLASLVLQLQVLFTIGLAVGLLGERLNAGQVTGATVALAGMAVIAAGRAENVPLGALALSVAAALSWAVGNVVMRRAQAPGAISMLVWSSLVAPIPLAVLSLLLEGPADIADALASPSVSGILALLYIVLGATAFGFGSWNWLMRRHPASRVAPFTLVVPPVGIAAAWIALGERPNTAELAGAVIVLVGLALTTRSRLGRRAAVAPPVAA